MPKVRVSLSIGISNARQEDVLYIDDGEWADCETDEQRDELIHEYWVDWIWNYIDGDCEVVDE